MARSEAKYIRYIGSLLLKTGESHVRLCLPGSPMTSANGCWPSVACPPLSGGTTSTRATLTKATFATMRSRWVKLAQPRDRCEGTTLRTVA